MQLVFTFFTWCVWKKSFWIFSSSSLPLAFQVQGMSFIAAVLILNLEEAEAFITFANLLNKPCQMAFFRVDHDLVHTSVTVTFIALSHKLALKTTGN